MYEKYKENQDRMTPLVSVVIPTHNRAELIGRSVASVLNQSYKNLEVIIVDDASTDHTVDICKRICEEDHRVLYYRSDINRGPAPTRNYGVEKADGEYIAFHDDDDEWHRDKLEIQMTRMQSDSSIDMVFSQMSRFKDGSFVDIVGDQINWELIRPVFFQQVLLDTYVGAPTILIKTEEFNRIGGFCEQLENLEDWEFSIRAAKELNIDFIPLPLVDVSINDHSVSYDAAKHARSWIYIFKKYLAMAEDRDRFIKQQIIHFATNCCAKLDTAQRENILKQVKNHLFPDYIKESLLIDAIVNEHLEKVLSISRVEKIHSQEDVIHSQEDVIHSQEDVIHLQNERHARYIKTLYKLVEPDIVLANWLLERQYKHVTVYGIGKLGKALVDKLSETAVIIERLVDRSIKQYSEIKVQTLSEFSQSPGETDVIIITPLYEADKIGKEISEVCDIPCISIEALLED